MSTRTITGGWWWWVLGAAAILWAISASVAAAATKVPIHTADLPIRATDIGPSDAPVRNAILTTKDRQEIKVQPARWGYGGYYGYVPYYGGYYSGPYVSYYPRYYSSYYYPAPYTTYYAPTYYSASPGPYYSASPFFYAAPVVAPVYRFPRRAFYGGYYW